MDHNSTETTVTSVLTAYLIGQWQYRAVYGSVWQYSTSYQVKVPCTAPKTRETQRRNSTPNLKCVFGFIVPSDGCADIFETNMHRNSIGLERLAFKL